MDINQNDDPVFQSIDKLSQEMAALAVKNERPKLIEEIEEDILNSAKKKNVIIKEINSDNAILFSNKCSDMEESNLSERANNNSYSFINQRSQIKNNDNISNTNSKRNDIGDSSLKEKNNEINSERNNIENSFNKNSKKVSFVLDKKENSEEIGISNINKENLDVIYQK